MSGGGSVVSGDSWSSIMVEAEWALLGSSATGLRRTPVDVAIMPRSPSLAPRLAVAGICNPSPVIGSGGLLFVSTVNLGAGPFDVASS